MKKKESEGWDKDFNEIT